MHNIYELEKRWRNYKIRFYTPHIGASIVAVLLLISIYNTVTSPKKAVEISEKKDEIVIKEKLVDKKIKETPPIAISEQKENTTVAKEEKEQTIQTLLLEPSLDFMKKLRMSSINTYDIQPKIIQDHVTQTQIADSLAYTKKQNLQNNVTDTQKVDITFEKQDTIDDINHVIKRFNNNNNPALSLFIAKKYYKLKDYRKAYNYALITNEINNEIDESWIIFAKSLVKMKEKKMAIETLQKYIKQSNSNTAKILLDEIRLGKYK